jgi:hypothetical protein
MIKLQTFIEYLLKTDWENIPYRNPRLLVFGRTVDGQNQIVQLPASEEYSDYESRTEDAIQRIASCEGISIEQARKKISGELLIIAEDIIELIEGKINNNPIVGSIANKMNEARNDVLKEILEDIKTYNSRLIELL